MSKTDAQFLRLLFSRRTIRKFRTESVADQVVQRIVETGQRAPSACNLQTYTVVWVKDAEQKERVWDACGVPKSIRDAPIVFVICADVRRLAKALDYLHYEHCLKHGYGYPLKLMGIIDASLAAENMTIAAEGYGLGSVFIGSALVNERVIEVLKLPKGVLPLTLLCVGYPDEKPPTRPRLPLSAVMHVDSYRDPSNGEIESFLKQMDSELEKEGYYRKYSQRKPPYFYRDHIKGKTALAPFRQEESKIVPVLRKTGFLPNEAI